ncbi:hypothetical protein [Rhodococcus sp. 1168]|nr:hypothetical protein [Rhodococcus sp. 1168]
MSSARLSADIGKADDIALGPSCEVELVGLKGRYQLFLIDLLDHDKDG